MSVKLTFLGPRYVTYTLFEQLIYVFDERWEVFTGNSMLLPTFLASPAIRSAEPSSQYGIFNEVLSYSMKYVAGSTFTSNLMSCYPYMDPIRGIEPLIFRS